VLETEETTLTGTLEEGTLGEGQAVVETQEWVWDKWGESPGAEGVWGEVKGVTSEMSAPADLEEGSTPLVHPAQEGAQTDS
jgi:hypothetical protein